MLATIIAFFGTGAGQASAAAVGLWILGMFGKSAWYGKVREGIGRGAEGAGAAVSALGNSKLKGLWNPIELVFCDFLFFAVEQFAVGLRKDNPEKMEQQLERLESVGSQARAEAVAAKLADLAAHPDIPAGQTNAEVLAQAVASREAANLKSLGE